MNMVNALPSQKVTVAFLAGLGMTIALQVADFAFPAHPLPQPLRDNLVLFTTSLAGWLTNPSAHDVAAVQPS